MEREIERFEAILEDGRPITIVVYTDMTDGATRDDPGAEIPGLKHMRTSDGQEVKSIDDNLYIIIGPNRILVHPV